jgi:hypothetical protein
MIIFGWTPRGLATASATVVLGPRLDSSMLQGGHRPRFGSGLLPARGRSGRAHRPFGKEAAFAICVG